MKTISLFGTFVAWVLSLATVKADLINPGQQISQTISNNVVVSSGVAVVIIAIVAWLIIRKIKKKNVSKSTK